MALLCKVQPSKSIILDCSCLSHSKVNFTELRFCVDHMMYLALVFDLCQTLINIICIYSFFFYF